MEIVLRPARPEDAEAMVRWFVDLTELAKWGGPDVRFPLTSDQLAAWIDEGSRPMPRVCYTAVDSDGRPVGHVEFRRDPARKWARLGRFAVAPVLRGQGFGRALFEHAVLMAFTELGVEHLALAVATTNERAIRLYRSCGFSDEGAVSESRTAEGRSYLMQTMGLVRPGWIELTGARGGATRVA
jgi:RimJ/RimL family protein N-acetyltransferase